MNVNEAISQWMNDQVGQMGEQRFSMQTDPKQEWVMSVFEREMKNVPNRPFEMSVGAPT